MTSGAHPDGVRIAQASTAADIDAVRVLLREYLSWVVTLAAESDRAPTFQGLERELAELPGVYVPPPGGLFLARADGEPSGCIALKPRDDATVELKRLYVRPGFRGRHIGRHLVAAVIDAARRAGDRRLILDSHVSMTGAHAIYLAAGFRKVATPADFPESLAPVVVFMELDLTLPGH